MSHAESEHGLMIEVATLRRELSETRHTSAMCVQTVQKLRAELAAANARADAAVAEIVNEQRRFGEMQAEAWKLEEALAAARRECDGILSAMRATHVMCGVCETDIYGEDGILVSSQVADCPPCKMLRDTLAGKGPCESTMSSDKLFYHCTLRKDHVGPHADREIAEWTDETHRDAALAAPAAAAGEGT